jgi:6-phosphogluconolactonase
MPSSAEPNTQRTIAFVSSAGTKEVIALGVDLRAGRIEALATTAVPGPEGSSPTSMPMALSPDRRRLYVAVRSAPYPLSTFGIDPDNGELSLLSTVSLPDAMAYIATDRTGRLLFGASYLGAKLSVNSIGRDGEMEAPARQILPTPPKAHSIIADLTNRWVFATSLEGGMVLQFSLDGERGMLMPNPEAFVRTRPGAGPRHLLLHPNGRFVYMNNELDASVTALALDAERGTLEEVQTIATLPSQVTQAAAADMHITPDGRFLYSSERTTSSLAVFAVDRESGKLELVGTCATEPSPRGFNISPCGRCLLVAGQTSNRTSLYSIDGRDGSLTKTFHCPTGANPNWIEFAGLGENLNT